MLNVYILKSNLNCFDLFQVIYGDSSVLFHDSPTRQYLRHSSDQVGFLIKEWTLDFLCIDVWVNLLSLYAKYYTQHRNSCLIEFWCDDLYQVCTLRWKVVLRSVSFWGMDAVENDCACCSMDADCVITVAWLRMRTSFAGLFWIEMIMCFLEIWYNIVDWIIK